MDSAVARYFRLLLFFSSGSRALRGPPNGYAIPSPSNRAVWRSKADGPPIALERQGRSPLVSRPFAAHGVARGGRAVAHGDECDGLAAVASRVFRWPQRARRRSQWPPALRPPDGSSAADSVKPNAAPSPSRESALRREIISVLLLSFTWLSPSTHDCRTGMALGNAIILNGWDDESSVELTV